MITDAKKRLEVAFSAVQAAFLTSPGVMRLRRSEVGREHYAWYLRQVFHHTRENPQIQALATVYFRGHQRSVIKRFFRHASSEIGHDQLACADLHAMGMDTRYLAIENPLPETMALIAFPFHQIYNLNPIGYIGYLYFLEFLPTGSGAGIMTALQAVGIPANAMGFLSDHSEIDISHNQLMDSYVRTLITSERELRSAIYAMQVTGTLYSRMVEAAFAQADRPVDWGFSAEECSIEPGRETSYRDEPTGERPRVQWPVEGDIHDTKKRSAS